MHVQRDTQTSHTAILFQLSLTMILENRCFRLDR